MRSAAVARMQADASAKSYWVVWSRLGPVFELVCRWWWQQQRGCFWDLDLERRADGDDRRVLSSGPNRQWSV